MNLTEKEKQIISILTKKEYTEGHVKKKSGASDAEISNLLRKKYLERYKKGRYFYLNLTELGKKDCKEIIQKVVTSSPSRGRAASSTTAMKSLIEETLIPYKSMIENLDKKLDLILNRLNSTNNIIPTSQPKEVVPLDSFIKTLKENWIDLDRQYRWGGRVEIPMLRRRFRHMPDPEFDEKLLDLEKRRIIDLQIASDPTVVQFPDKGIQHPSRGLIYYIIWRK